MKKSIASVLASLLLLPGAAMAKEASTTLKVKGWHCGSCSQRTAKALKAIEGVREVAVDFEAKTVKVDFDDEKTSAEAFEKAVTALKYSVEKVP